MSPNIFYTEDFKAFRSLTEIFPENHVNWLTSELHTWDNGKGGQLQGILYKPQNFDKGGKYPLIIFYYEKMSNNLNICERPELAEGWINIPWFVSRGYLVFTPDIHYTVGEPGNSAFTAVMTATKYLSGFNFVDTARIGLTGHSFGGYETNYIITRTGFFKAAVSAASVCNLVSMYGDLATMDGASNQAFIEFSQYRLGKKLWDDPDMYIRNSPVFFADKVSTPLFMMNNKLDAAVSFSQGVDFFTALRRLGKKVWMIQYDGEFHSLGAKEAKLDFTQRITGFFDHYLNHAPPPEWMIKGISARQKGTMGGLGLEKSTIVP